MISKQLNIHEKSDASFNSSRLTYISSKNKLSYNTSTIKSPTNINSVN